MITAREAILEAGKNGRIFSIDFIKRTTGELRSMQCRLGVAKYVNGVGMAYKPENYNLITVYDMQFASHSNPQKAYRSINLDGVIKIKVARRTVWNK